MKFDLWPECEKILKANFVYDKIFDLLRYDNNLDLLVNELSNLKKESYDPTYRFIFLHYDTDYYLYPGLPGITLTNLQQILVHLDIPNYFCLLVTNYPNIGHDLTYLQKTFSTDPYPIAHIVCQLQKCHIKSFDALSKCSVHTDIKYKYSCLNNSRRVHRRFLISLLSYKNLLDHGLISYVA
jgi:hypothetical protein